MLVILFSRARRTWTFRAVTQDGGVMSRSQQHRVDDDRFEWQVLNGDHVSVWWYEGGEAFANRALDIAEEAVGSAASLLGVEDVEPVDFIIYGPLFIYRLIYIEKMHCFRATLIDNFLQILKESNN